MYRLIRLQRGHRHVQLVAACVFQGQKLGPLSADLEGLQAEEAADTVFFVDDRLRPR